MFYIQIKVKKASVDIFELRTRLTDHVTFAHCIVGMNGNKIKTLHQALAFPAPVIINSAVLIPICILFAPKTVMYKTMENTAGPYKDRLDEKAKKKKDEEKNQGVKGSDPYEHTEWSKDVSVLPNFHHAHIYYYMVLSVSAYTHKMFINFRSLQQAQVQFTLVIWTIPFHSCCYIFFPLSPVQANASICHFRLDFQI